MNHFHYLKRKEIDEQKWNELITRSLHSLPYAFTWYLDAVAENWEAIVLNNYEAAMPLVWLRKFGFKCLYQPYYCQQLGVFSKKDLDVKAMREFLAATKNFPYININLNPTAKIIADDFDLKMKKNLLLNLNHKYSALRKNYSQNHCRNIAKAEKNNFRFTKEVELKAVQKFYLENINRAKENFKPQHEKIFKQLSKLLVATGYANFFTAVDQNNKMMAAVCLLTHQNRLIALINTSSTEGKKNGSSHFLFDQLIQKYSGTENMLDFEGSSIPGIARFYRGFGAQEETFYQYQTNALKKISQRFQ